VPQDPAAIKYLEQVSAQVRAVATAAHQTLVDEGCTSYVKTIYIGYEIGREMVAALYAYEDHVEVALALPEDQKGALLIDASHLTWRTLPVAANLKSEGDLEAFVQLAKLACDRVRTQQHDVMRDNEYFARFRRERNAKSAKPS
jgi:hypothetical protein